MTNKNYKHNINIYGTINQSGSFKSQFSEELIDFLVFKPTQQSKKDLIQTFKTQFPSWEQQFYWQKLSDISADIRDWRALKILCSNSKEIQHIKTRDLIPEFEKIFHKLLFKYGYNDNRVDKYIYLKKCLKDNVESKITKQNHQSQIILSKEIKTQLLQIERNFKPIDKVTFEKECVQKFLQSHTKTYLKEKLLGYQDILKTNNRKRRQNFNRQFAFSKEPMFRKEIPTCNYLNKIEANFNRMTNQNVHKYAEQGNEKEENTMSTYKNGKRKYLNTQAPIISRAQLIKKRNIKLHEIPWR